MFGAKLTILSVEILHKNQMIVEVGIGFRAIKMFTHRCVVLVAHFLYEIYSRIKASFGSLVIICQMLKFLVYIFFINYSADRRE